MTEDKRLYDAIKTALIVGITLTIFFNVYMREHIKEKQAFSEIYFKDHRNLPDKLRIGESAEVTFTLTNHEFETITYTYEVDSKTGSYKENVTLLPGQEAEVMFSVKPQDRGWSLNLTVSKAVNDSIEVFGDYILAENNKFNIIIGNTSPRHYLPISHKIEGLGYVYHTNLSVKELQQKPFKKTVEETTEDDKKRTQRKNTLALTSDGERIFVNLLEKENNLIAMREPFIVKFYNANTKTGEELEVHFWYDVVA